MTTRSHKRRRDTADDSEIDALEKMLRARCRQIESMAESAGVEEPDRSREKDLQIQAFTERRAQAMQQLASGSEEPRNTRVARLERLLEALDCSREFFHSACDESASSGEEWGVLIR